MHFSIPDTEDIEKSGGSSHTVFHLHVNGVFHCSVRYSQLHSFHEQLKREFGQSCLPSFPPKKLLSLNVAQLEERRLLLERYIQQISQVPQIANGTSFNSFLLDAQKESQQEKEEDVTLDVFLMNGHKISVDIVSTDQTDSVHEAVSSNIGLSEDYTYYFGLFLMKKEDSNDTTLVRRLQEFESPYISLKAANKTGVHRIVVRKSFWDASFEDELLEDRVAMNLLYVQAVSDVERSWTHANKEQHRQLQALQQRNSKKEYLRFARTLKYYGFIHFHPSICDYPQPNSEVFLCAGNQELCLHLGNATGARQVPFKVTRMRCWRITTTLTPDAERDGKCQSQLELAFEYLVSKDVLKWITIRSKQAILISMCLQGMVEELLLKKQGRRFKKPQGCRVTHKSKQDNDAGQSNDINNRTSRPSPTQESQSSIGSTRTVQSSHKPGAFLENHAFQGIGDDDL